MAELLCPILKRNFSPRMRLFPVDERLVELGHVDNNAGAYLKQLPEEFRSLFATVSHLDNAQAASDAFMQSLLEWNPPLNGEGIPIFDVLFCGLGPDGHTCSLFPIHPLLEKKDAWMAPIEDSPKPPPRRVTLTLPALNAATQVAFLVTGESKAQVLKEILQGKEEGKYPPQLIQLANGNPVHWFLDEGAGGQLG